MAFSLEVDHQAWKETEIRRLTNQYRITGPPSLRPSPLSSFCLLENRVLGKQDDSSLNRPLKALETDFLGPLCSSTTHTY